MRSQSWRLVRFSVTPVFMSFTGSVINLFPIGQKNSRGGALGPAYECRRLLGGLLMKCSLPPVTDSFLQYSPQTVTENSRGRNI